MFFFFQAEDGIRDLIVTGVQTCALPISSGRPRVDRCAEPTGTSIDSTLRQRHRDKRNRARSDPPLLRARREGDPSARRNAPIPVPGARRLLARREPLVPGEADRVAARGLPSASGRATRPSRRARSGGYGGTVWGPPSTAAAPDAAPRNSGRTSPRPACPVPGVLG